MNCTFADTFYPLKCSLTPELPNNEGLFRPITIHAPEGSVLNTTFPSAVKSRSKTSFHLHVVIYGALQRAMPDRIQAGSGSFWAMTMHGVHDDGSTFNVHVLPNGGKGATARGDGLATIAFPYNGTVTPTEIIENQAPVVVEHKRLVPNSGGAGRYRGGLGQEMQFRVVGSRPMIASARPDKVRFPPPGARRGRPGLAGRFTINGRDAAVQPHRLVPGDRITLRLPGGGGYGDPRGRPRASIQDDIANGYVTRASARANYGSIAEVSGNGVRRGDSGRRSRGRQRGAGATRGRGRARRPHRSGR
jgi:N-methylhydantoinase B